MELELANLLVSWVEATITDNDVVRLRALQKNPEQAQMLAVRNFLPPGSALELATALNRKIAWSRCLIVSSASGVLSQVSEEEWSSVSCSHRFSRFDVGKLEPDSNPPGRSLISGFFVFVMSTRFLEWINRVTGFQVRELVEWRISQYQPGDFIVEHRDSTDGRRLRLNLYLDPDWTDGDGGILYFRNSVGEITAVPPSFNTIALSPININCVHWVSPFCKRTGRLSIALNYR